METLENKPSPQADNSDLKARLEALQHLVVSILILVVVMSGTLNIYLLRQWRTTSKDLAAIRPQATQMIAEYQKSSGPAMENFVKRITEYGHTHPDFVPVLAKYGLKPAAPTNAPPVKPAATAPAAPKK